jgi:hypothetical protein
MEYYLALTQHPILMEWGNEGNRQKQLLHEYHAYKLNFSFEANSQKNNFVYHTANMGMETPSPFHPPLRSNMRRKPFM